MRSSCSCAKCALYVRRVRELPTWFFPSNSWSEEFGARKVSDARGSDLIGRASITSCVRLTSLIVLHFALTFRPGSGKALWKQRARISKQTSELGTFQNRVRARHLTAVITNARLRPSMEPTFHANAFAALKPLETRHRSSRFQVIRHLSSTLSKLGHDLFVQPNIHFGRAIESACVAKFLGKLLAGGKAAVQFQQLHQIDDRFPSNRNLRAVRREVS